MQLQVLGQTLMSKEMCKTQDICAFDGWQYSIHIEIVNTGCKLSLPPVWHQISWRPQYKCAGSRSRGSAASCFAWCANGKWPQAMQPDRGALAQELTILGWIPVKHLFFLLARRSTSKRRSNELLML